MYLYPERIQRPEQTVLSYPLLQKAGLPRIRFHDLRHTRATLLLAQGIHPKVVQEQLGYSRSVVTLDVHSHVLPNMVQQVANAMEKLFDNIDNSAAAGDPGSCQIAVKKEEDPN